MSDPIVHLLPSAVHYNLEACEREQLELKIKYGLEHEDFERKLEAGELGNEFGYDLEIDAMRWDDLITEKKYWLQQLSLQLQVLAPLPNGAVDQHVPCAEPALEDAIAELAMVSEKLGQKGSSS